MAPALVMQQAHNRFAVTTRGLVIVLAASLFLAIFDKVLYIPSLPLVKTLSALFAMLAFGLFVSKVYLHARIGRSGVVMAIIFLVYISFVEFINSHLFGRATVFARHMQWVQPILLFIMSVSIIRSWQFARIILVASMATVVFMAVCVLLGVEYFTSIGSDGDLLRRGFSGLNLNREAYYYSMGVIVCVWFALHARRPDSQQAIFSTAIGLLLAYSLFNTGSRGGLIVMAIGLVVLLVSARNSGNPAIYKAIIPVMITALVLIYFSNDVLQERLSRMFLEQHYSGRDKYFWVSIDLMKESPYFGYGSSIYDKMGIALERYEPRTTHNGILQVILTFGIGALAIWIIMLTQIYRNLRKYKNYKDGSLAFTLFMMSLLNHAVADMAFDRFFWVLLAVCLNIQYIIFQTKFSATSRLL